MTVVLQVNSVNCNTSWKINLFMMFSDHREEVLKGVSDCSLLICWLVLTIRWHVWPLCLCLAGGCCAFVPCWAGKVSNMRRVQSQASRVPANDSEAVGDVCNQLQCIVGDWGDSVHRGMQKNQPKTRRIKKFWNLLVILSAVLFYICIYIYYICVYSI